MEEVVDHLPQGEMEEMVMVVMMEMVVEEMIHHCHLIMDSHDTIEVEEIDGCMLYKRPPRPPSQPGQDGRDGQDAQAPQLPRGMINVPGVAPAPLDTTGLENSFENLGRTTSTELAHVGYIYIVFCVLLIVLCFIMFLLSQDRSLGRCF